jgi:hypothetical protein
VNEEQKLVTVGRYASEMEAHLAQMVLEEAGIRSVILGEPISSGLYPVFEPFLAVQVFEEDAARASALLEEKQRAGDLNGEGDL